MLDYLMLDFLMLDCLRLDWLMLDWLMLDWLMLHCLLLDYLPDKFLIQSGDHAEAKLKGYYTHKHAGIIIICISY